MTTAFGFCARPLAVLASWAAAVAPGHAQAPTTPADPAPQEPTAIAAPVVPTSTTVSPDVASVQNGLMVSAPIVAVTKLHNTMSQELNGIGLVDGLNGTGSSDRSTRLALTNMIRRFGLNITQSDVTSGAVAMVRVTGRMEPFAAEGSRFSVKVSSLGDATSLYGGNLVFVELAGVDRTIYATAQGPVLATGVAATGDNASVSRNHPTTGWVEDGAQVVRELNASFFSEAGDLELRLNNPSAFNARSVANGCRVALKHLAYEVDAINTTVVRIKVPRDRRTPQEALKILTLVRSTEVPIEHPTRVVIDAAAGVVVAGGGVRISPCAVSLAELTITVVNDQEVSQPYPGFNSGTTERVNRSRVEIDEAGTEPQQIGGNGATVEDLLKNLRDLSLSPSQMVTVFRTLHQSGYLHAELIVR